MKRFLLVFLAVPGSLLLAACASAQPSLTPTATATTIPVRSTSTPTPAPVAAVTKLEAPAGTPPTAGWKWAVAQITAAAEEVTEAPIDHRFDWIFYVLKGSTEVSTADSKNTIPSGGATVIRARQQHGHRYLPQTQVLAFVSFPFDFDPPPGPGQLHRGTQLFLSEKPLETKATVNYTLRMRELSLPLGGRGEGITVEANLGYVIEGTLTLRSGDTTSTTEAGKFFSLPTNASHIPSNEATTPLRLILLDLRPQN